MLGYYFELAIRSLRRTVMLTALMIAAVGVGIGASMTALTTLRAMSGNPIPDRSSQLFTPSIDAWGPASRRASGGSSSDRLPNQLTYRDADALMKAHRAQRQAAMYLVALDITPSDAKSFQALGRATYADFFSMFEVPFRNGLAWGREEENARANVVVLSSKLADRVFPHTDAVGKTINIGARDYRVVGVIQPWSPTPRFYDLDTGPFNDTEDFYIPFTTAIDRQINSSGSEDCQKVPVGGWDAHLNSSCTWVQLWAELPTATQVRNYKEFLYSYAAEQRRLGRFHWPPRVELRDVMDWLAYNDVVTGMVQVDAIIGAGFLVVCLVNALGLMLAKFASRTKELALRRALGASRMDIFLQCITETTVVGLSGGLLGLGLTAAGLFGLRGLLGVASQGEVYRHLFSLDVGMVLITLAVAVVTTVCSGLYPTLRASRVQPAWQLKTE